MSALRRAVLACLACVFASAHAEERPQWELGVIASVVSFPDYRGSSKRRSYLLPLPYVAYRSELLQADQEKVRGLLFKYRRAELDLSVNGSVPVRSSNNPARQGMPDLDPTLELGPSLNFDIADAPDRYTLRVRLPVRAVIATDFHSTHDAGVLAHPQLNLDLKAPDEWKLGFVAGPLIADRRYHEYFYGVAPQYATPDRPAYAPHGGYSGMQLIAATSKHFDRMWFGAFVKYDNLDGATIETSPLVKRHNNVAAGFAVSWTFAQSSQKVDVRD